MATIFDQYESQQHGGPRNPSNSILGTTTFRNKKLEEEAAIFLKDRQVNFSPPHPITHLVVSNHRLVLAMANKTLIRINLLQPNNLEEIDLGKFAVQARIHRLFLDPTGQHLLVGVVSRDGGTAVDTLYLPLRSNKPKSTSRLKGHLITAVGWNPINQSDSSTGPILVGTSKGLVMEVELTSDERLFQTSHEEYCKVVYDLKKDNLVVVTGLEVCVSPKDDLHYLILCSTLDKLYQFTGRIKTSEERPMYTSLFNNYLGLPPKFHELPSNWKSSWMQIFYHSSTPKHFAWMTEEGICTGEIVWGVGAQDDMTVNRKLHPYPEGVEGVPVGLIVCEFHVLVVWPDKIRGICVLNSQVVFEGTVPEECGKMAGIAKDPVKGTIWIYAERGVFKYKVEREGRNVWKIYLEQKNYELAKQFCSKDAANMSVVLLQEAQDLFLKKEFCRSARLFAKTLASFEEITLKFVEAEEEEALKVYLHARLEALKGSEQTQVTLVVLWLLELYLKTLGKLRDAGQRNTEHYASANEQLRALLRDPKVHQCVVNNSGAIYELLASHDDQDNYVMVCMMLKDHDRVVRHLVRHARHHEALEVLATQGSEQLFYQHMPALLPAIPRAAVDALIAQGRRLSPARLVGSLVACGGAGGGAEVARYLEHCVDKLDVTDQVVHNLLVTLYAQHDPAKLLPYLVAQGHDAQAVHYDLKFALRECHAAGEERACVHVLTVMGLYTEAIELALRVDPGLAKATANRPRYDQDLRKKLWLMIAAHVVGAAQDVGRAMEVLRECDLIKIEDVLPFFPDFVTIDQFKDAICASLQEYNQHIQDLRTEMDDAARAAEAIRKDVTRFKQRSKHVKAQDRCCECHYPLLTRPFYLFPCSHAFHQDCLTDAVITYLPGTKQKKVSELKGKLVAISSDETTTTSGVWGDREQIRAEVDALVAGECLYCGDHLVNNIDTPFIADSEWESLMAEWQ